MYNCDETDIVKFDADFDEDFDNVLMDIMVGCKRIYFFNSKGFGIWAKNPILNLTSQLIYFYQT